MDMLVDARYRLRLAEGFAVEPRQDLETHRWRSCVDSSQLAVENAAKVALALLGPVGRTHDPSALLRMAVADGRFPPEAIPRVERLADCAQLLGPEVHIRSDYGDQDTRRTPWELFDEADAVRALAMAEDATAEAQELLQGWPP